MIPPDKVQVVKKRWDNGDPIHLTTGSIPADRIKSFRISGTPFTATPLLEAAAQAFNEPILNEDGSIVCRWVKRNIPSDKWNRHFSSIPAYKRLGDSGGMVVMAYKLPIHEVDVHTTSYCTDDEVVRLTRI